MYTNTYIWTETTQVLYGPEYTGLIQVSAHSFHLSTTTSYFSHTSLTPLSYLSHTSLVLLSYLSHSCLHQVKIWRYGHWVTVYIDDRYLNFQWGTIQLQFSKALSKVASEKRWLLLCSLFRSKGVLGNFPTMIFNH